MKNVLIVFLLAFVSSISYSQNLEIDKRNGFKSIKLGSHLSYFEGATELTSNDPSKIVVLWNTDDADLGYFFDNRIDFFELTFDKATKELIMMKVVVMYKKPFSDSSVLEKFKEISKKLIVVVGKPSKVLDNELSMMWFGERVGMSFLCKPRSIDYDEDGNVIGITTFELVYLTKDAFKKVTNKGF